MAYRHNPDLVLCRRQPGIHPGRLCASCEGKCPICDSYVRPTTLVRICDECAYGAAQPGQPPPTALPSIVGSSGHDGTRRLQPVYSIPGKGGGGDGGDGGSGGSGTASLEQGLTSGSTFLRSDARGAANLGGSSAVGTGQGVIIHGRCLLCNGPGVSDAYYCRSCTTMEKDREGCPKIANVSAAVKDWFYEQKRAATASTSSFRV